MVKVDGIFCVIVCGGDNIKGCIDCLGVYEKFRMCFVGIDDVFKLGV